MGISHAAYLGGKAVPKTAEASAAQAQPQAQVAPLTKTFVTSDDPIYTAMVAEFKNKPAQQ